MAKFCDDQKEHTDKPQWFDPLGPNQAGFHAPTGGPEMRSQLFDQIGQWSGQMGADSEAAAAAFRAAATDPTWGAVRGNARDNAYGRYLSGGPQLNRTLNQYEKNNAALTPGYSQTVSGRFVDQKIPGGVDKAIDNMRQRTGAEAADTGANIRSSYNRAGLGFSTANQQAEQANRAASSARANETAAGMELGERQLQATNRMAERAMQNQAITDNQQSGREANQFATSARVNNYGQERARQTGAGEQLTGAINPALQYLSQAPTAYLGPIAQIANIVQGLTGNGQIATPRTQIYEEKGWGNDVIGAVGSLAGAAGGGF
jgi:hypothetical protein